MANSITTAKKYVPLLDEIYKNSSLTSDLDGAPELAREGANAGELLVAKMSMQGLGEYDRNSGYVNGDVTLTWETIKADFDRGRMFSVDNLDNKESIDLAFGRLSGEFIRTKVVPELDAWRFAKYAGTTNVTKKSEALTSANIISALRTAINNLDEAEVSVENRILYITPTLYGVIADMDTTKSKEVLSRFAKVVEVPQTRFYTGISQKSGATGEVAGGYEQAVGSYPINFMIVEKSAVVQHPKHVAPKIVSPELNQSADAWKFGYRHVSVAQVYENKTAGVYVSHGTTAKV